MNEVSPPFISTRAGLTGFSYSLGVLFLNVRVSIIVELVSFAALSLSEDRKTFCLCGLGSAAVTSRVCLPPDGCIETLYEKNE